LMSVAEEEEGEGEAGLEVDDRPSMLPEHWLPVSAAGGTFGNFGGMAQCGRESWCGSGRESVCSDGANQNRSWGDWIEQSQIARHGLGGRGAATTALERSHLGALARNRRRCVWGTWALGDGHCAPVEGAGNKPTQAETQNPKGCCAYLFKQCSGARRENRQRNVR
jgi:hypothetical protein